MRIVCVSLPNDYGMMTYESFCINNPHFTLYTILKRMIQNMRIRLSWQTLFGMSTDTEMESVVDVASSPINTRKKEAEFFIRTVGNLRLIEQVRRNRKVKNIFSKSLVHLVWHWSFSRLSWEINWSTHENFNIFHKLCSTRWCSLFLSLSKQKLTYIDMYIIKNSNLLATWARCLSLLILVISAISLQVIGLLIQVL